MKFLYSIEDNHIYTFKVILSSIRVTIWWNQNKMNQSFKVKKIQIKSKWRKIVKCYQHWQWANQKQICFVKQTKILLSKPCGRDHQNSYKSQTSGIISNRFRTQKLPKYSNNYVNNYVWNQDKGLQKTLDW